MISYDAGLPAQVSIGGLMVLYAENQLAHADCSQRTRSAQIVLSQARPKKLSYNYEGAIKWMVLSPGNRLFNFVPHLLR